jgi:hypothetical protein
MTWLEIYVLLSPVLVVCVALLVIPLTRWQDEREDRRRAARPAKDA